MTFLLVGASLAPASAYSGPGGEERCGAGDRACSPLRVAERATRWVRGGETFVFRLELAGVARDARLVVSADPASAVPALDCGTAGRVAGGCLFGEMAGGRWVEVRVDAPAETPEIVLTAVAHVRGPDGARVRRTARAVVVNGGTRETVPPRRTPASPENGPEAVPEADEGRPRGLPGADRAVSGDVEGQAVSEGVQDQSGSRGGAVSRGVEDQAVSEGAQDQSGSTGGAASRGVKDGAGSEGAQDGGVSGEVKGNAVLREVEGRVGSRSGEGEATERGSVEGVPGGLSGLGSVEALPGRGDVAAWRPARSVRGSDGVRLRWRAEPGGKVRRAPEGEGVVSGEKADYWEPVVSPRGKMRRKSWRPDAAVADEGRAGGHRGEGGARGKADEPAGAAQPEARGDLSGLAGLGAQGLGTQGLGAQGAGVTAVPPGVPVAPPAMGGVQPGAGMATPGIRLPDAAASMAAGAAAQVTPGAAAPGLTAPPLPRQLGTASVRAGAESAPAEQKRLVTGVRGLLLVGAAVTLLVGLLWAQVTIRRRRSARVSRSVL
ncbi:hypothetical protein [Streptosporangium sp. KLBMP 9127]|nr:hypothetical protein [Streptosporangium sp. KLBMP 9127]